MGRTCYYIFYVKNKVKAYLVKSDFLEMTRNNIWFYETPDIDIREREKIEEYYPESFKIPKRFRNIEFLFKEGFIRSEKMTYEGFKEFIKIVDFKRFLERVWKIRVYKRAKGYEVYGWCKTAECDFDVLYLLNVARKISEKYGIRVRFEDEGEIYYGDIVKGKLKGMEISDEVIAELKEKHFKILEVKLPKNLAKFFKQYPDYIDYSVRRLMYFVANSESSWDVLFGRKQGKLEIPKNLPAVKFSDEEYPFATLIHKETYEAIERLKKVLDMTENEILKFGFRAVVLNHDYMFQNWIMEVPARYLI